MRQQHDIKNEFCRKIERLAKRNKHVNGRKDKEDIRVFLIKLEGGTANLSKFKS